MSNDSVTSIIGNQNAAVTDGNNSLILAGNGNDTLIAGASSIVTAGNGSDKITVAANSIIIAGNGNDTLTSGANSLITVGNGNDTIAAGANSLIVAGNGNDTLYLGANNIVTVGNGKDTFVLPSSSQVTLSTPSSLAVNEDGAVALAIGVGSSGFGFGNEAVLGFNASNDKLQFNTSQFANFAAVMASAKQVGNDTVITGDASDTIVLSGVRLSSLTASDFSFVGASNISVTISGIPAGVTLSDTAGTVAVTNGSATLTQAQLAGLTLKAGEVTAGTLTVTATDASTGHSVSKTIALSVNPVAPTLTGPASLTVSAGAATALGITETPFDARDTISLTFKGVPADASLSAGTKNADGTWTLTPAQLTGLTLKAGSATTATLTVTATNTLGQTASTSETIQLNVVTPLKVTFDTVSFTDTGVQGDHITNNGSVTLSGTVTDNLTVSQVQVFNGSTLLGTATVDNLHHTWSLTEMLADGTYNQLVVKATDSAGTTAAASTTQYVQIDTTAPALVSQGESVSGLTQSKIDVITVSATDASGVVSVAIYDDVTGHLLGNATLTNGTWSYSATGLTDGAHNFYAVITDAAGNQTKTADLATVTVDTTPPALVSQSESVSGLTQSKVDVITVNATDANGVASVAIYDDAAGHLLGNATLSNGTWSYSATGLADGAHNFYAVITDAAGNQTKTTDLATVTVDTTPPTATISASVTGATNVTSDVITVNAADANGVASVAIDDSGNFIANATQTSPGVWNYVATGLSQGSHDFTAVVTDNAGNSSTTGHASVLVDTTAPSVTFDTVSYDHTGAANFTKDGTVTLSGTTADNVTVSQVQVFSGTQLLGNAVVDNTSHTWTLTENLGPGIYTNLSATATDEAGNSSAASNADATQTLQVDQTAPSVTFATVSFVDTGTLNDGITGNNLVTLSGSVTDDVTVSQVQVFNGSQLLGNAVVDNNSHTWTLTTNLADGTYANLNATATDEAGNTTSVANASTTSSLQIDTASPTITFNNVTLTNPADTSGTLSSDGGVTLSGTVSDNVSVSQVQVFNGTELLGTANVVNGAWTLTTTLAQGSYNQFHATATDEAGNVADAGINHVVTVSPESGYVIDGYIQGATVFADTNGNGKLDPGEASGVTDASGHFVLGPGTTSGTLVLTGGIDTATNLPFTGVMTAPTGSSQVTPLTTLVQSVAAANGGDVASASQAVANALGLDPTVNLTSLDTVAAAYAGNSQAFVAASEVLNTVSMVASAVAGTGASDFSSAASGVFSALASQIVANGSLDLSSSSVVSAVVSDTIASVTSGTSTLTSDQTSGIATVVTSVNQATDQAVADSGGSSTAVLLTNVSATSIVAQGSASAQLQQATSGAVDLSTVVANNTGSSLSNSVEAAVSQVGSVAPAAPTVIGLTPTDSSPNNANLVHYLLTFSDPVTGVNASDFSLTTTGLTGASIAGVTQVSGSNGTQYSIAVSAGSGNGSLALSFTGTTVQDLANNALADQTTHVGSTYVIDQDTNEQAALSLTVTNTQVNTAGSAILSFAIAGLGPEDTGVVTFTDGQNKVTVNISAAQTNYTANLGTLTDGTITSSLAVNTDAAGNSFSPVAGTSAVALSGFNVAGSPFQIIQNGTGDITVDPTGSVTGQAGDGVIAEQSASGTGNIIVNATSSLTGTGTGSIGLLAENLNAANGGNITVTATGGVSGAFDGIDIVNQGSGNIALEAGGAIASSVQFGIRAEAHGTGSVSVVTDAGSTINSGGAGVSVLSFATAIAASANSTITVTTNGTINSGTTNNPSGSVAQGVAVGYYGANGTANTGINGTVVVNNNANITAAAGYGIDGYNYGNGNVTVNEGAGTSVSGAQYGIGAFGNSFGTGNIAVNVAANATLSGGSIFGIQAFENEVGSVSVTTAAGDVITGGSSGINAQSQAASDSASSSVTVIANGTIHSGSNLTPSGSTPGGIVAGYSPNGQGVANGNVAGNVFVQSNATIVAAAGAGINAYNYGTGNVTVTTGATSSITAATTGNQADGINANALNGGNVSVTNGGSLTAGTGIFSSTNHGGSVTIENDGQITATALSGINVSQSAAGSTGSATITNTGTVIGAASHSAINVTENPTGTVTINNSGTIGAVATAASTSSVSENGGIAVVINNSGQIDGGITTTNTGAFTGTLNNNAGASWQAGYIDDEGTITASGTGSVIAVLGASGGISVANNATGSLTVAAGAALTADYLNIGQLLGSSGSVTVTGAGTTLNTTSGQYQNILAGNDGTASLTIADHAVVTTTNMEVANDFDAGVTDTLIVDGATLNAVQNLTIGGGGTANATVRNGGTITTGFLSMSSQAGSAGSLTVTGEGSVVTAGGLGFGSSVGSATLNVSNGGAIDIGTGTTAIADAVHIGSSASLIGAGTINANVVDDGNITALGLLDITGVLSETGSININDGGTLELAGSGALSMFFAGGNDALQLDNTLGFSGTIAGFSGSSGNFTVTGLGNVTAATGDAIDFTSSGGVVGSAANVIVTAGGAITGAANGINIIQNGGGDITVEPTGSVTGQAGDAVIAEQSSSGTGNIVVNATGSLTGTGTGSIGLLAENLNAANVGNITVTATGGASGTLDGIIAITQGNGDVSVEASGMVSSMVQFGVRAASYGTGNIFVLTDAGSTINSGGAGLNIANFDTMIDPSANSMVTVTNNATINSGPTLNPSGSAPDGIVAGYFGSNGKPNQNINGTVLINNNANITAVGYGIDAYNWGIGNVTLKEAANTSVSGTQYGLAAFALSGGTGNVTVSLGDNATVSSGTLYGIEAYASGAGNVNLTTGDGDVVNSGSYGVLATNAAASLAAGYSVTVNVGADTIHASSGGGINAGYTGGANNPSNNVHGNVFVTSDATITTGPSSFGINAFNWGTGDVTVDTGASSSITASGNGINANAFNGGNVYVTTNGTVSGADAVFAQAVAAGNVTVDNDGTLTGTLYAAIDVQQNGNGNASITNAGTVIGSNAVYVQAIGSGNVDIENDGTLTGSLYSAVNIIQNASGATGSTTITNTGTLTSLTTSSTIGMSENTTGRFVLDNSGTINESVSLTNAQALYETGGDITINNTGTIDGGFNVGNGTFNNEAGGIWQLADWSGFGFQSTTGIAETSTINNAGTIDLSSGAYITANNNSLVVNNTGTIDNLSGYDTITGSVSNSGTIEVIGGTLDLSGGLSGVGALIVDNGGTLELTGAGAETITFSGGTDTLQLDNALGFTGTIAGVSSTGGTFAITGFGNLTTTSGDAIDFTASGGTSVDPATIVLTPGGNLTGAANGLMAVQNGAGDINIATSGAVTGEAGYGILAEIGTTGSGNIDVTSTGGVSGSGTGIIGLLAENLNAANGGNITVTATGGVSGAFDGIDIVNQGSGNIALEAGGAIASSVQFGIRAEAHGTGSVSVVTDAGSTINSGGAGVSVLSFATAIAASANSTITVTTNGTINSGTTNNPSGSVAQGVAVGYYGANGTANTGINGTVVVNNNANITAAAGYGIDGYNYGNGNVTVNEGAGTSVSGAQYGIGAFGNSFGTGNIAVNVAANATLSGGSIFGIQAFENEVGSVSVTTAAGDVITGGSSGINAQSQAASDSASSSVTVIANGTIHSGSNLTPSGSTPGGIVAGYSPNGQGVANGNVAGNVFVQSNATIVAAAGAGINAYNYGTGNVTVTTGATSSITAATTGNQADGINANALNGGNVSVTNGGSLTAGTGIFSSTNHGGSVTIENDGQITATALSGINVSQNSTGSTGSTTITNSGTVVGAANQSSIIVNENAFGTVTINNSGLIGPSVVSSSTQAIYENGGTVVINNAGQIDGSINTSNTGAFTGTLNNNAGATWQAGYIDDEGTITASGTGSAITIVGASNGMTVGYSGTGALTVEAGAAVTAGSLNIGQLVGSHGAVDVTGAGTTLNTTVGQYQNILVGLDGTASLAIADHAVVTTTNMNDAVNYDVGVTDTIDVNDATLNATQNMSIAGAGTANATVENGGTITAGFLNIGSQASGTGSLTVTGAGSVVTATNFLGVGSSQSSGTLAVSGGGSAISDGGIDDEGTITASGTGSAITVVGASNGINVGYSDTGNLSVAAGATLTTDFLNIAQLAGSTGTVNVTGAGTTLNTTSGQYQEIAVGFDGTAELTIADQAVVTTTNMDVAVNFDAGVTDTLVVNGATLNSEYFNIADAGTANATVENGGIVDAGSITIASQAGSTGSLTVTGAGSVVQTSGLTLGSSQSSATLAVANGGAVDIGAGTITIADAVHVGLGTALQGAGIINGSLVDDGSVIATGGLLEVTGELSGTTGSVTIDDGATLELAGSGAEIFTFAGGSDMLQLDNALGFTGTLSEVASAAGNFTVTGQGNVTSGTGDAIDFTSSGNAANMMITLGGTITGAVNGINVIQNGSGDITLDPSGSVVGQAGDGVIAEQSATGIGNIFVNASGSLTGTGTGSIGLLAENLNAANSGNVTVTQSGGASGGYDGIEVSTQGSGNIAVESAGAVSATVLFGIRAQSYGTGSISVVTDPGSTINSGGSGLNIINFDTAIAASADSMITVTTNGTINSGTTLNPSGSQPQGIVAGYYGASTTAIANTNVNGTVVVNNNANITAAAGYGIDAYNYGNGNVTVNEGAGTSISGAQYGIGAFGNSFGTGNIAVNVAANATLSGGTIFGIQALENEVGSVSVTTATGDVITGGSSGINAQSQAASDSASSSVTVIANGTIHSGTNLTPNGSTPGGIVAGYSPNGQSVANGNVAGNVFVQSNATIVAAAGAGINAYNYGTGNVTVTTGATSSTTGATTGTQADGINANALNGGNVSVTNGGSVTGGTGIFSSTNHGGSITLENDGLVTATALSGINISQSATGSTGSVTITNTGTVVGAAGHSAINVTENAVGTVTINNSGTIGTAATAASTPAITENGGIAVIINNGGEINGSVLTNSTGGFTGTLDNNAGATWQSGFIDDEGTITALGTGSVIAVVGNSIGMTVGNSATGIMTIEADAMLTASFLNIGNLAGSHGTVDITGAGTTANFTSGQYQNIGVGFDGTASLTIADHAAVTTTNTDVAAHFDAGVTDTLDINNATLISQNIIIGDGGTATATVENGGTLTAGFISLALQPGSTGSLTVDGAGSLVTATGLNFGSSASSATLTITGGGAIDIGTGATTVAGAVHVGSSATLDGAGTIHADLVNDGSAVVTGGMLDVTGAVTGSGTFTIDNGAHLEFGSSVAATDNVVFQASTGSLILDHSSSFAGLISGFTGDGTLAGSDQIDLADINYTSSSFSETFDPVHDTLSVSDGTNSALLHLVGTYVAQNFSFTSDGGTGTIVYDPPVNSGTPASHGAVPEVGQGNTNTAAGDAYAMSNGSGFSFAHLGDVNSVGSPPLDLSQVHSHWSATPPMAFQALGAGDVNPDGHVLASPFAPAGAELHLTHFHLV